MRDPKQWAKVPVPLKREIISAMGGQASEDYKHFRKLAVEAYIILRKHASLFLTLLSCMAGSSIDCFSGDTAGVSLDFVLSQVRDGVHVDPHSLCVCPQRPSCVTWHKLGMPASATFQFARMILDQVAPV